MRCLTGTAHFSRYLWFYITPTKVWPLPLTFNHEQSQSYNENWCILIYEIGFHLFTRCFFTWIPLGAVHLTVLESVLTHDIVLNLELSLLNETLKISLNVIFWHYAANCYVPRLSGLNCSLWIPFSPQHTRTDTRLSLSTRVLCNTPLFQNPSVSMFDDGHVFKINRF